MTMKKRPPEIPPIPAIEPAEDEEEQPDLERDDTA